KTRKNLQWLVATVGPKNGVVLALWSGSGNPAWPRPMPPRANSNGAELQAEGFRLVVEGQGKSPAVVWIHGTDSRGVLFGVGQFLRSLEWANGAARIPIGLDLATAPAL